MNDKDFDKYLQKLLIQYYKEKWKEEDEKGIELKEFSPQEFIEDFERWCKRKGLI